MPLYPIALLAGLLPIVTINLTYWLSASHGQVEWCIPYLHSCTSISATGREAPAYFVFKGLMIPAAIIMMLYWFLSAWWLRNLGCGRDIWHRFLIILGFLAGIGLAFYSLVLGWIGDEYRLIRHTGVSAFFGLTFFAQLLMTWLLEGRAVIASRFGGLLLGLKLIILVVMLLGLVSVVLGFVDHELYKRTDDAIAWNFTVLLCLHVLISAELWRRTGWRLSPTIDSLCRDT